ncbi:hypothetical protein M430DRAFT_93930, partial [Amorphotheca resinae ATCC 22711]
NVCISRLLKKLNTKYTKFIVIEVVGLYSYRLNTLLGIYNVFSFNLLRLVSYNLFLLQEVTNN